MAWLVWLTVKAESLTLIQDGGKLRSAIVLNLLQEKLILSYDSPKVHTARTRPCAKGLQTFRRSGLCVDAPSTQPVSDPADITYSAIKLERVRFTKTLK